MRRSRRAALALTLAAALAGCGAAGPSHRTTSSKATTVVNIARLSFNPKTIVIHAGDTVEFRNTSMSTHSVTNDPKLAAYKSDAAAPAGVPTINTGPIPPGNSRLITFTEPGWYRYFSEGLENERVIGSILVQPR